MCMTEEEFIALRVIRKLENGYEYYYMKINGFYAYVTKINDHKLFEWELTTSGVFITVAYPEIKELNANIPDVPIRSHYMTHKKFNDVFEWAEIDYDLFLTRAKDETRI